jgi:hypothetical protein
VLCLQENTGLDSRQKGQQTAKDSRAEEQRPQSKRRGREEEKGGEKDSSRRKRQGPAAACHCGVRRLRWILSGTAVVPGLTRRLVCL